MGDVEGGWVGGSGGEAPSKERQGRLGNGALSVRRFLRFFNKNNAFLGIFRLKFQL